MTPLPAVTGPKSLANSFLGNLLQVCVVTADHQRALAGFVNLGIGPWTIRKVDASNLSGTYRGAPADFEAILCLASSQNMNWEVIQPLRGRSIYADFLQRHGEGMQHLAFNCDGIEYAERVRQFEARGYQCVQEGVIFGGVRFHYFSIEEDLGTTIEIYAVPPEHHMPPADAWYPAPPP
jgi:methylmalonyl-CoA/ethylmalonyl-CoA epimerase